VLSAPAAHILYPKTLVIQPQCVIETIALMMQSLEQLQLSVGLTVF
jgi:hypothetical protein